MLEISYILMLIISLASLVAFGFVLVAAFKESVLWGLAVLLIPLFGFLVYAIKFWAKIKKPALAYLATVVLQFGVLGFMFTQLGGMEAITVAQGINDGTLTEQEAAQFMVASMDGMEEMGGPGKEALLAEMRKDPNVTPEQMAQAEQMFGQMEKLAKGEIQSMDEGWVNPDEAPKVEQAPKEHLLPKPAAEVDTVESMEQAVVIDVEPQPEAELVVAAESNPEPEARPQPSTVMPKTEHAAPVVIKLSEAEQHIGHEVVLTTLEGIAREGTLIGVNKDSIEIERREFGGAMSYKITTAKIAGIQLK